MSFPQFRFPTAAATVVAQLPVFPPSFMLARILNAVFKRSIERQDFQLLYGKRIVIRISDIGVQMYFTVDEKGFRAIEKTAQPDLAFIATAHDYYLLASRQKDPDALFFNRRLLVEGDTELGLIAKNTLDGLELPQWVQRPPSPKDLLAKFF
ncbi:MAG: SCP2 sterol-binding domain-containing protein [Methylobacillus sp.]|jgi:predicted lipid carrier protein YhbT|nr:SCP2 sterol-binding domain-containing protein [Methylobacillus sp.]